ncbi:polA [Symbiodinium pilosum]|uniref:PolA protein n=1 Tax=Symbiodinium pilosum TaxID=2952 RepID=A0A812YHD0_SYMPI|nr:polA [Symbiodinium pilosum]
MGLQCREDPDFEADDLIASYTRGFDTGEKDVFVKIISSDKDLLELVNGQVELLDSRDHQSPFLRMDVAEVWNKWGVRPHQMPDLLALMGDSADNIPGVPGIGAKRAGALLGHCGTLKAIVQQAQDVGK